MSSSSLPRPKQWFLPLQCRLGQISLGVRLATVETENIEPVEMEITSKAANGEEFANFITMFEAKPFSVVGLPSLARVPFVKCVTYDGYAPTVGKQDRLNALHAHERYLVPDRKAEDDSWTWL
jgi:hypothetical protein